MKKGSYYFGLLTEEEKEQFNEATKDAEHYLNFLMNQKDFKSLEEFISSSFYWDWSPQGHEYWQNIANSNRENIEG